MKRNNLFGRFFLVFWIGYGLALGQESVTHVVQQGETIYSIAKRYKVTPFAIYQKNPEIKKAEEVGLHTVLVIPAARNTTETIQGGQIPTGIDAPKQETPISYMQHRVRKKETLFGISKAYGVTEEQIKRYNTALYSKSLKKGMVLKIPKYAKVVQPEEREIDFETYVVAPKETRWSIAHKYGISVDSLLVLNPGLSKSSSYLAVGQELRLPRPIGDSLKEQEVVLYESFTVPKSVGLFRLSQDYGVGVDSIMALNPQIAKAGGLKEGMVLRLPKPRPKLDAVTTENYVFYEVRPKDNLFRLTRNLGIGRDSLLLFNPELENGLKAGMVLKLPRQKNSGLEVKDALVLKKFDLVDSLVLENRPKLLLMLPFRLDRLDLEDSERAEAWVKRANDTRGATGFYSGALMALDSIRRLGLSAAIKVLDTERDLQKVRSDLEQLQSSEYDAIIGPIDLSLLPEIALRAKAVDIPVVAPYAAAHDLPLSNVFFSSPSDAFMREGLLDYVEKNKEDRTIIVIADEGHTAARDSILSRFPMARVAKMSKDGSLHLVDFQTMLSEKEENWVFVETDQPNLVASVTSILNASNTETTDEESGETSKVVVRMFTTNYNAAFEKDVSKPHLSNLRFTFPSIYKDVGNEGFSKAYQKEYGYAPDRHAARGFDLVMDVLLKLGYRKDLFEVEQLVGETEYSGNRFNYYSDWSSGFYNRAMYLLQYEDLQIKQLKEE